MIDQSWLLVFDNVEDVNLKQYWPPSSHGSILLTSQRSSLSHQTTSDIALEVFDEEEGAQLIMSIVDPGKIDRSQKTVSTARAISNEIGGLPILLSHVAGFADGSKCSLPDLLSSLQEPSQFMKIWAWESTTSSNFQYGELMLKLWRLAIQALSLEAKTTLLILAMLNPDGVPEKMLRGDWHDDALLFLLDTRQFE
jgi:hypothetical protein